MVRRKPFLYLPLRGLITPPCQLTHRLLSLCRSVLIDLILKPNRTKEYNCFLSIVSLLEGEAPCSRWLRRIFLTLTLTFNRHCCTLDHEIIASG